jgi:hypothetical protein
MTEKRLPKSIRKFLRRKKAEIRSQFSDPGEQEKRIKELLEQIYKKYENQRNI